MSGLVLIAEGDPFNLRLLEELCEEAGFDVVTAGDGSTALSVIARQRPALVVLDTELTTDDGADVLEVLTSDASLARIPVLLTTAAGDEDAKKRGVELGAADFVTRPYRVFEVEQRIRNLLRLAAAERVVETTRASLVTDPADGTDPLTRAGGAGQLRISLEYEATRAIRYGHPLTCLVLRVTNFAEIVARSGEETGQGLLVQLVANVRAAIRGIDHLFRSDTDELTILLPETADAEPVVERLRREGAHLGGAAIEPAPVIALGRASIVPGGELTDGDSLWRAARSALTTLTRD
ncbi:MAG: response regulator [Sandaracinaceae bacterium]|nr:response regulator [Sandaracinaceae bacterium]